MQAAGCASAIGGEGKAIVSEVRTIQEKARRVLQAAAAEAYGKSGVYVSRDLVLRRANISDPEEFWSIAGYLYGKGWIAEADDDFAMFAVTPAGVEKATR